MRTGAPALKVIQGSLAGIAPVESGTLGQRVYQGLRDYLMAGQLQPGRKLTLRELASALNVSPMPVREAVRRLAAEGALEMLPNRRIRVPLMTKARFRELLRIRVAVEGLAVEEAARRIRGEDVDRMEELNRQFAAEMQRRQADGVKLWRINKDIHFIMYEAAGMPNLLPMIEGLWLRIGPVLHLSLRERANANARGRNPAPDWHKRLILGLRRRDAAAARRGLVGDMTSAGDQILAEGNLPD
ncbi:MAG TPA: GntR family transcriptional regulator [Burkholderiales bacterium]|jgi:DNA-binding GntR family transcriptional regulator|nr:GntR family transcriptional regulator [Burkholderiales bacterium]